MSDKDSGPPRHWPFVRIDPSAFKVPERKVTRVFLHCTANDNRALIGHVLVEEVNRWHIMNGWQGIGYHFIIDKDGNVMTGRDIETTPAAQLGRDRLGNVATIAICTHGMWEFTEASLQSTLMLCRAIDEAYLSDAKAVTFHGHCEIDPRPCPVYDYKNLLGLDPKGAFSKLPQIAPKTIAAHATKAAPHTQEDA